MTTPTPNPVIERLGALAGGWAMEASVDGQIMGRGRMTFVWRGDRSFLAQRVEGEPGASASPEWEANAPFPVTAIIGLDDTTGRLCMLYADARGVYRIYEMSLTDTVWKLWRDAPGFSQRFTGTFGDDGATISGSWEGSTDGSRWEHDFDVTYTRDG